MHKIAKKNDIGWAKSVPQASDRQVNPHPRTYTTVIEYVMMSTTFSAPTSTALECRRFMEDATVDWCVYARENRKNRREYFQPTQVLDTLPFKHTLLVFWMMIEATTQGILKISPQRNPLPHPPKERKRNYPPSRSCVHEATLKTTACTITGWSRLDNEVREKARMIKFLCLPR
jgi:hypothetical protein